MALNKILLFSFLTIFSACKGQEKTNTPRDLILSEPGPTVIKNFKAAALAPDFDTTLVSQYIRSIFQDSKGNLWFGTLGEGVVRYDVKTLTYFSNPDGFIAILFFLLMKIKTVIFGLGLTRAFTNMTHRLRSGRVEKPLEITTKKMA